MQWFSNSCFAKQTTDVRLLQKKIKNKIRRRIEWVALRKDQIPLSISLLSGLLSHQNSTAKGRRSSQLGGRCAINAFSSKLKLFLPIRKKIIFF